MARVRAESHGGDLGGSALEYVAVLALAAGVAMAVFLTVPQLGETISSGVSRAVCAVLGGQDCGSVSPGEEEVAVPDGTGEAADPSGSASPVADFLGGGLATAGQSAQRAVCLAGLCGGDQFTENWTSVAHTATPSSEDDWKPCRVWALAEGATPTRPDGSPREQQQVGTFNMYGNVGHGGDTEPIVSVIEDSVNYREPTFLGLQEVCETQAEELNARLGAEYEVFFDPRYRNPASDPRLPGYEIDWITCDNGSRYGTAIVYRTDFADDIQETSHSLGSPDGADHIRRSTPCVSSGSKNVVFCTAHLQADLDRFDDEETSHIRETEAANLSTMLAEEYDGYTTLLTGDLNDTPDSGTLDHFYDPRYGFGAEGNLKEVSVPFSNEIPPANCRRGQGTTNWQWGPFGGSRGKKLDYVFVSNDVEIHNTEVKRPDDSDHNSLWSDVTF